MNDQTSSPKKDEARPEGEAAVNLTKDDIAPAPGVEEALRAEVAELNDRILRLAAEVENTRRRGEREKADAGRYAISNFARDLLTVADTFERALAAAPGEGEHATAETITSLLTGLKLTERELLSVLERNGVRRVYPKGEKFDPNLHQAVAQAPGSAPAGYVEEVAQPGFTIGDRVLRAAMVIVSTGPGSGSSEAGVGLDTRA
ncbi:MAG TPA: nucleotide exchange factor GrpE [Parvularculaceae bacterium]|nr:nucleotide exchange factor GrpE [Amphiplicatus sp.]MCB9956609.1 nucleotide exchange factor GrpE [Caulobacterales bacterium]HOP18906.1 nucleotide exchange factor GrpE [Amphiplicatus sp.]HPE32994.1 nucleotide exchange factor GrpE [Parvularculaceae bacterium]HRX38664.1 nucleotide exchange factor GrpE [Parvularculaceae bacterium]